MKNIFKFLIGAAVIAIPIIASADGKTSTGDKISTGNKTSAGEVTAPTLPADASKQFNRTQ